MRCRSPASPPSRVPGAERGLPATALSARAITEFAVPSLWSLEVSDCLARMTFRLARSAEVI